METTTYRGFLLEILNNQKYQELKERCPLAATYFFDDLKQSWDQSWVGYKKYRDEMRAKQREYPMVEGRWLASVPVAVITWLEFLVGRKPSKQELKQWLKGHPEFWIADKF